VDALFRRLVGRTRFTLSASKLLRAQLREDLMIGFLEIPVGPRWGRTAFSGEIGREEERTVETGASWRRCLLLGLMFSVGLLALSRAAAGQG
jgi:hypothetical protein